MSIVAGHTDLLHRHNTIRPILPHIIDSETHGIAGEIVLCVRGEKLFKKGSVLVGRIDPRVIVLLELLEKGSNLLLVYYSSTVESPSL